MKLNTNLFWLGGLFIFILFGCQTDSNNPNYSSSNIDSLIQVKIEESSSLALNLSDQNKAIDIIQRVITHQDFNLAKDSLQALTYHKLARSYIYTNKFATARNHLDSAIIWRLNPKSKNEDLALANSYFNRSLTFFHELKIGAALKDITLANQIIEKYPDFKFIKGKYYAKTARYYFLAKEFIKAEEYFEQAQHLLKKASNDEAEFFHDIAYLLIHKKQYEAAIKKYDEAISIYSNLPNGNLRAVPIQFNRFDLLTELRPYQEAKVAYSSYLSTFQDSTFRLKNFKRIGHNNLAYLNIENNDLAEAEKNYSQVLKLAQELTPSHHSVILGCAYEGLGDVAYERQQYDKAIQLYHSAIQSISIGFDSADPLELPNPKEHVIINDEELERIMGFKADAVFDKYKVTNKLVDLKAAFFTYQQLDQLLVNIRQGYKAVMSRYDLVNRTIEYYEKATQVAWQLYQRTQESLYLEAAYSFASKNKAVIMLDGLQDEQARFAGIPKKILQNEADLKKEIYRLDGQIYDLQQMGNSSIAAVDNLIKKRFEKTRAYEDMIEALEANYPKYHQLKYANTSAVRTAELRSSLPTNTAVIEYFVGKDSIYIFTFSPKSELKCTVIKKSKKLNQQSIALRKMTEKDSLFSMMDYATIAYNLYHQLLEKPLQQLQADDSINRLVIIPDDLFMQISFESFFTAPLDTAKINEWTDPLPYLLRDYAISYSYSNQLLFDSSAQERVARSREAYIGFGLEYDDYTLQAIEALQGPTTIEPSLQRGMGKLIYSDDEVLASAAIWGGKYFINKKATKSNFIKTAADASILHLVTHGFVVRKQPLNSGLIFTKQHAEDDFILKAGDLYSMDLQAELAVLSACHTGDGKIQKGEGIRSLARAFNFAGCPNVIASLWAAPDLSTKEIIVYFYEQLKAGQSKDLSLQAAKLFYLDQCGFNAEALPCNWAHLVNIGAIED